MSMNDRHRTIQRIAFREAKRRVSAEHWAVVRVAMQMQYGVRCVSTKGLADALVTIATSAGALNLGGTTW